MSLPEVRKPNMRAGRRVAGRGRPGKGGRTPAGATGAALPGRPPRAAKFQYIDQIRCRRKSTGRAPLQSRAFPCVRRCRAARRSRRPWSTVRCPALLIPMHVSSYRPRRRASPCAAIAPMACAQAPAPTPAPKASKMDAIVTDTEENRYRSRHWRGSRHAGSRPLSTTPGGSTTRTVRTARAPSSTVRSTAADLPVPLGGGEVIRGWDEGVAGMKVGGKRTLDHPAGHGLRRARRRRRHPAERDPAVRRRADRRPLTRAWLRATPPVRPGVASTTAPRRSSSTASGSRSTSTPRRPR